MSMAKTWTRQDRRESGTAAESFSRGAVAAVATVLAIAHRALPARRRRTTTSARSPTTASRYRPNSSNYARRWPNWQFFIERHLDEITPGAVTDPTELIKGSDLLTKQNKQAATLTSPPARHRVHERCARSRDRHAAFTKTLAKLAPVASGTFIAPAELHHVAATERAALERVWTRTTGIGRHLSQDITKRETVRATDHLDLAVRLFLACALLALIVLIVVTAVSGRRAGRRERRTEASLATPRL